MSLNSFIQQSGFKLLALARLSEIEYSIVFYLLNCVASGLQEIITNKSEMSSLTGYSEDELVSSLMSLREKKIISIRNAENLYSSEKNLSLSICFELNISKWNFSHENKINPQDAIVYPFRRNIKNGLHLHSSTQVLEEHKQESWELVFNEFIKERSLTEDEIDQNKISAKTLVETHSLAQVYLMVQHFSLRIPALSLLASSWQHYLELFESETQKIDFIEARKKHTELDEKLRNKSQEWLKKAQELNLNDEEIGILKLLINHRHPRRQIFWAYQVKSRYRNLFGFFEENFSIMLPITTSGVVIKKNNKLPK